MRIERGDYLRTWLEEKRSEFGFTQEEVAISSDIARTTYAMIEQGKRTPSVKVAKQIANTLNFNWIIFFENKVRESCNEKDVVYSKEVI